MTELTVIPSKYSKLEDAPYFDQFYIVRKNINPKLLDSILRCKPAVQRTGWMHQAVDGIKLASIAFPDLRADGNLYSTIIKDVMKESKMLSLDSSRYHTPVDDATPTIPEMLFQTKARSGWIIQQVSIEVPRRFYEKEDDVAKKILGDVDPEIYFLKLVCGLANKVFLYAEERYKPKVSELPSKESHSQAEASQYLLFPSSQHQQ